MAKRFVYQSLIEAPFAEDVPVEFAYFNGFSLAQKQRSIDSLHASFLEMRPQARILEVSSKGREPLGVALSAFNLMIVTSRRQFSVECAFQGSKVFERGGPYVDLLDVDSRSAKKDPRIRESGNVVGFRFHGTDYPTEPKDLFYNWLYVNALNQHDDMFEAACAYDAFTDIEFNPAKSINCQARALAIAVGLRRAGQLDCALESVDGFCRMVYGYASAVDAPTDRGEDEGGDERSGEGGQLSLFE